MVNIVIVAVGPRGDVQPYCILGQALAARGHQVKIATEKRLERLVAVEYKLPYEHIAGDICGGLFEPDFQDRFRIARSLKCLEMLADWNNQFDQDEILESYVTALEGADMIICGSVPSIAQSYSIAEKTRALWVPCFLGNCPLPTSEFPHWILAGIPIAFLCSNKWSHTIVATKLWMQERRRINAWRRDELGLPPITTPLGVLDLISSSKAITVYQACSVVLCGPKRQVPSDYAPNKVVYTGFLASDSQSKGSVGLQRFLKTSTSPIIYIGFGGMPTLAPLKLLQLVIKVCALAKCKCVLVANWAAEMPPECEAILSSQADIIHVEASAPHTWLFPQMSCIVHHAGFGTTATALRSGVPQIPCPVVMDQFHNANEAVRLGVAPTVIHKGYLTASYLAKLVRRVLRNERNIQTKAKELGAFVSKESSDSVATLCEMILNTRPTFMAPIA